MSVNNAYFPTEVWDGISPFRVSRFDDRSPDYEDWDQMVSEVLAAQTAIKDGIYADGEVGAAAGTGVVGAASAGHIVKTVLTLDEAVITIDSSAVGFGSLKVFDPPAGNVLFLGATADLTVTVVGAEIDADAALIGSIGTVAAADDATLTSTEANIVPSTAFQLALGTKNSKMNSTTPFVALDPDVYLNFVCPDADRTDTADDITISGTITLTWLNLGDV